MADDAAAEERRRKAQARKDKLAARGADRLAKITGAAKGEDGEERFGTGGQAPPQARPVSPAGSSAATSNSGSRSPPPAHSLPALAAPSFNPLDDPPEVDISTPSSLSAFQSLPNFPPSSDSADGSMPDLFSALLGGASGPGGPTDGMFPDAFAQMLGGGGPGSGPGRIALEQPSSKTWTERLLPVLHLFSMLSLAFFAVFVLEPRIRESASPFSSSSSSSLGISEYFSSMSIGKVDWNGWAALGRGRQALHGSTALAKGVESTWEAAGRGVARVQLFYLFLTLELMLQGAAILIFKTRPRLPALLNTFMPYLPPNLAMYAHTGIKYWSLFGQIIDDLAVLVLSVTSFILFAEWKQLGGLEWADAGSGGRLKMD